MGKAKVDESILIMLAVIITIGISIYFSTKPDFSVSKAGAYTKVIALAFITLFYYLWKAFVRKKQK